MSDESTDTQTDSRDEDRDDATPPPQPVSAVAGSYFRRMRYIFSIAMLVMGGWFCYDGFVKYPQLNAKIDDIQGKLDFAKSAGQAEEIKRLEIERTKAGNKHSDNDILIQRLLGILLIPGSGLALWRWLHMSRGEYRLENDIVHVPGHPPIPLSSFTDLDDDQWDKKGIAVAEYKLDDGTEDAIKLDDFVYDRPGIDGIHAWIRATLDKKAV
ncbi:MAG: hypothetical protein QM770_22375 [Tepidisphaeraceae bacterium]